MFEKCSLLVITVCAIVCLGDSGIGWCGDVQVISMKKEFETWASVSKNKSLGQKTKLFEEIVVDKYPEVFNTLVFDELSNVDIEQRLKNAVKIYFEKRFAVFDAFDFVETEIYASAKRFNDIFHNTKKSIVVFVMPSIFRFNGREEIIKNQPIVGIGVEYFTKESPLFGLARERQLEITVNHELFHAYHINRAGFMEDRNLPVKIWVWIDGLATYASGIVNQGSSDRELLLDPNLAEACANHLKEYSAMIIPQLSSVSKIEQDNWFSRKSNNSGIPSRMGYCIGLNVVKCLAKKHSINKMSQWNINLAGRNVEKAVKYIAGHGQCAY